MWRSVAKPPRAKPEPEATDAPPLNPAEKQTDNAGNNIPWEEHRSVRRKQVFRPKLEKMRDEIHERARREKEWSIEAVERDVCDKPAFPERGHEQDD
jgi:uncharacterized membrane protein